jgi:signal transduction histidine kinase
LFYGKAALSQDAPSLAKIYELSREFSRLLSHKSGDFSTLFNEAERHLGISREVINDILLATFEQVEDVADNLRVELNKERDLIEIMEKANRVLSEISGKMTEFQEIHHSAPLPSFDSLGERRDREGHTLQAVAHEIRNPLLAVGGFARKLAASLDPTSKGGEYAKIILEEASRLEHALNQMTQRKT